MHHVNQAPEAQSYPATSSKPQASSGAVEFEGAVFHVSPNWPKAIARFGFEPTVLPPDYIEALRKADERATRREQVVSLQEAKRLLLNALTLETVRFSRALEVDDANRELFSALAGWIAKDPNGGFDPAKGIALLGNVGAGKTLTMRAVRRCLEWLNSPQVFTLNVCTSVFDDVKADPDSIGLFKSKPRCFDDLGEENAVLVDYGNRTEVMREVFSARHRKFEAVGLLTHFTTNRTLEDLENQYGSRIDDRLRQMCNVFEVAGKSRRR